MKKLQTKLMLLAATIGIFGGVLAFTPVAVNAAAPKQEICEGSGGTWDNGTCTNGRAGGSLDSFIKNIVNILLFIIGAIAVIMIIVGGIRYTTSNGDSSAVTGAKNTILYSVIGLVVAIMAYAIVNWVLGAF